VRKAKETKPTSPIELQSAPSVSSCPRSVQAIKRRPRDVATQIKQLQARMRGFVHQGSGVSSAGNHSQQASPPGSVASFEAASSMASAKWQAPPTAGALIFGAHTRASCTC
jgi:hypothetical protein